MNIAELFIRRPVTTTLVMLSLLVFGFMGYRLLPVSDLPNVDFPTINVIASLPGASPETMAAAVALPLERQFSTIAGVDSMTSTSSLGMTSITLQFNLSRDIDAAAQDVQAAIAQANRQLPQNMPSPPSYQKVNPADQPVLYLAVSSQTLPLSLVNEAADTVMAQRISTVSGVAQVLIYGAQKYAVRVQLDPDALATRRIGIDEVSRAVQDANVNLPNGILFGSHRAFTVQATGSLERAADYRPIIVAYRNGAPVRLNEIGRVLDSVENDKVASWYRQRRAMVLAIQKQPGTNTVEVVDRVMRMLPALRQQIPGAVEVNTLYDRSVSIRESVDDVKFTLQLTIALVILVIFLFLRSVPATLIPSLAVPLSIVGTFAVMYLCDYSLDNLSLMALTLSVGFVVDDAIVMLENIVRHMEMGKPRMRAALEGSREISFTILSMTLSLAAVFLPVLFMGGLVGRLLHEFAVTIMSAILVSGFVSLTLTPMLCSRYLHSKHEVRHGALFMAFERIHNAMLRGYEGSLHFVMRHRPATMLVSAVILAATVHYFMVIPKGFLPSEDRSQIFAATEGLQGVSFEEMKRNQLQVARIVAEDPNVESFMSSVGPRGGAAAGGNSGFIFIRLKQRSERRMSVDEVIAALRPRLAQIPGIRVYMQNLPTIQIGGQLSRSQYQLTLQSPDTRELYESAGRLEAALRALPGLQDVSSDLQITNPQVNVEIDRDRAASLGLSAFQIEDALYSAYGSRQISTILAPNNQYRVILELDPQYQLDPAALSRLYIRPAGSASTGQLVPLSAVARITQGIGPLSVNHLGQLPAVTLSFNLKPGVALGDALGEVNREADRVLPATITRAYQGAAQAFTASMTGLGILLVMSIAVIYIILGILYESFIHPLTILSGLPSAGLGALMTLMLFKMDLNLYGFVGVIMLVGIVKKNAIMMIDFALEAERKEGKPPAEAIVEGCLIRFRPIMMTTMAALMGTLPIALGFGAGAEARRPLGLAVVGGLIFSQLITLYLTPVFYTYMEALLRMFRPARAAAAAPAPSHAND